MILKKKRQIFFVEQGIGLLFIWCLSRSPGTKNLRLTDNNQSNRDCTLLEHKHDSSTHSRKHVLCAKCVSKLKLLHQVIWFPGLKTF